jgi:serine/threonine protein kinase
VFALLGAHDGHGRLDRLSEWLRGLDASAYVSGRNLLPRLRSGLRGRYRVVREIGRGGMAIVFRAEDLRRHRSVAVKVLRPSLSLATTTARFLREIGIASRLSHPRIIPVHDSGEVEGLLFYVMPYLGAESLRKRLRRDRTLALRSVIRICRDVADALDHAHAHDVVHRDIKPENVILDGSRAAVTDFGIARAIAPKRGKPLTGTGVLVGTPAYMSPEQVAGARRLDGRSDVYSLACVTYEMLTGEPPYTGDAIGNVLEQHRAAVPPGLQRPFPGSRRVGAAIRRALAKSPADRFASAGDFVDALVAR